MIRPDTKDWTWVLERPCPDCGYDAAVVDRAELGGLVRANAATWTQVLALSDAAERPDPATWSPLEYACHIRDVHHVFDGRLRRMLADDEPLFDNWDQDQTAVDGRYDAQDPAAIGPEVVAAAEQVATTYDAVADTQWNRPGLRSNGSRFTVETLGRYHLHDLVHHAHDVRSAVARATVRAYDGDATPFSDGTWELDDQLRALLDDYAAAVGPGGTVLEIGSAGGRDAIEMERRGLRVRRTDVTPAFVELMRSRGYPADVLDPLTDELVDGEHGPYDGVWASACLLHVDRADLPIVLDRLAVATRPGGVLSMSVKEGDGEAWSTHGHVRGARHFVFWREEPLRHALETAGWRVTELRRTRGVSGQPWLAVRARRG